MVRWLFGGLILAALASPALAQEDRRAPILDQLATCRAMSDPAQRLACYDTTTAALETAERAGDVVVLDRAQVQEARRGLFGFSVPSLSMFGGAREGEEEDVDNVSYVVRSAREVRQGEWLFAMEDGSVWRQIDGRMWGRPRAGESAVVRRASLGSFLMNVGDAPAIRVRREQ
ncbi:MAG: hypothetical protein J0L52_06120 [Caulobacterales bacterium]|nr:hypothetical protein [Caulobacterales bacterium]